MSLPTPTLLQIDLQNLFFGARNLGEKIDFEKVWDYFSSRNAEFLTEALVYMVRSDAFDSSKFETKVQEIGYNVVAKTAVKKSREDGSFFYRNTNLDIEIAVDCMSRLDKFDKWILFSGDGDFLYLCKQIHQMGKKVEIWSFRECYNSKLDSYADKIHFIDKQFFYKEPQVKVFGFTPGYNNRGL